MKKIFTHPIIIAVLVAIGILAAGITTTPAQAAGVNTYSDTTAGTVILNSDEDGVLYLETETVDDGSSYSVFDTRYKPPQGFASDLGVLFSSLLTLVMALVAIFVFGYLIWGGFSWITSGGDKGKIDAAKQKIIAAVVGAIIVASSYAILLLIINFLGFSSVAELFINIRPLDGSSRTQVLVAPTATPTPTPDSYTDNLGELNT
jgi:hypothetical protein